MIQMTRQQYQQKYGVTPAVPKPTSQPIQMTRQQYQEKYGQQPAVAPKQKSLGGFAENIVKSGGRMVKDMASAAANTFNPNPDKNTAVNLYRLGQGIGQKLDPTEGNKIANVSNKLSLMPWLNPKNTNYESYADNTIDFYKNRYGGVENIKNTLYNDPVGVAADVATIAIPAGKGLQAAGAATKTAGLVKAGNVITTAGELIDPLNVSSKAKLVKNVPGVSAARTRMASGLGSMSDDLLTRGMGNPAMQAKAAEKAGTTVPDFMRRYNWYDRGVDTIGAVKKDILKQYDSKAMNTKAMIPVKSIIDDIDAEIASLKGGASKYSRSGKSKMAELKLRRKQILNFTKGKKEIPVSEATTFRRKAIDPDIPQSTFNLDSKTGGVAAGTKKTRDIFKRRINATDPQLERLGLDYGMAKSMEKVAQGYERRAANRQLFNFTKLGGAGLGGFFGGVPGAVTGFATEQIVNNPNFLKTASGGLKKLQSVIDNTPDTKTRFTNYYKPDLSLTGDQARVQENFMRAIMENPDQFIQSYKRKHGNVLNVDDMREFSTDYQANRPLNTRAVHEPASALMKIMYEDLLKDPKTSGKHVVFTGGGAGAGKSSLNEALPQLQEQLSRSALVLDGTMSDFSSSVKKIEQALNAGHEVVINYIQSDPIKAFDRAIDRAKKTGRVVPIDQFVGTHLGSIDTIKKIVNEYGNNGEVQINIVDNTGAKGTAHVASIDNINDIVYTNNELERILHERLEAAKTTGTISDETYQGFKSQGKSGTTRPSTAGRVEDGSSNGRLSQQPSRRRSLKFSTAPAYFSTRAYSANQE